MKWSEVKPGMHVEVRWLTKVLLGRKADYSWSKEIVREVVKHSATVDVQVSIPGETYPMRVTDLEMIRELR